MMLVTFVVWAHMYIRRTTCLISNMADLRDVDIPAMMDTGVLTEFAVFDKSLAVYRRRVE